MWNLPVMYLTYEMLSCIRSQICKKNYLNCYLIFFLSLKDTLVRCMLCLYSKGNFSIMTI